VSRTAWMAQRAALAFVLMVGFYVLGIAIAAGLLWIPYAEAAYTSRIHPKIALACLVGAGTILWALVPRRDRFEAPAPASTRPMHRACLRSSGRSLRPRTRSCRPKRTC